MIGNQNGKLRFKTQEEANQYDKVDFRIKFFADMATYWSLANQAPVVLVTSVYRKDPKSVHGEYRGLDLRISPLGLKKWEEFATWVNTVFDYGRNFNVVIVGSLDPKGKHNDHVHIQVPGPYLNEGKLKLEIPKPTKTSKAPKPTEKDE